MTAHVMCLTSAGGLPLFTRRRGEGDTLPFSVVASLNGVHMFGKSQGVLLESTSTQERTIVWKEMEDSVILIAAVCGASTTLLHQLLTTVFNAMILTVGIDELRTPRNVDRLKRDLRVCHPLVDRLLECVETASHTDLLGLDEVILCQENLIMQNLLDAYCECLGSLYGCVQVQGRTAVATPSWWGLSADERKLLALLVSGEGQATARDIPVFLPCKSPAVPFRLVTCGLVAGIEVCALCGPSPPLAEVEHTAIQCWKGAVDVLRSAEQCYPRNLPHTIQLDSGVMGLLLVDCDTYKFILSRNQTHIEAKKDAHRLDVLRTFYHQGAAMLYNSTDVPQALETYWCSEYHKCHALRQGSTILCVLYAAAVPSHTMRLITRHTLRLLTTDKQLCCTSEQLIKRTGKKGIGRYEYLQQLVNEYLETKSFEAKKEVLANLANFSYDPINYEILRQLKVIDIFLDELSKENSILVQFALGGLCNLALDVENKEYILHCNGVKIISSCLSLPEEEAVLSAITTLMFLVTPQSKPEITSNEIIDCMLQFSVSPNQRIRNVANIFLQDYCTTEQVVAVESKKTLNNVQ